jgi:hypothetical protein
MIPSGFAGVCRRAPLQLLPVEGVAGPVLAEGAHPLSIFCTLKAINDSAPITVCRGDGDRLSVGVAADCILCHRSRQSLRRCTHTAVGLCKKPIGRLTDHQCCLSFVRPDCPFNIRRSGTVQCRDAFGELKVRHVKDSLHPRFPRLFQTRFSTRFSTKQHRHPCRTAN